MKWLRGGGITGFIVRRLLLGVLVLFLVSIIVFVSTQALGDPARAILGRDATPDRLAALQKQLNLDSSKRRSQYFEWLGGLLHGDLGHLAGGAAAGHRGARAVDWRTPRCWCSSPR